MDGGRDTQDPSKESPAQGLPEDKWGGVPWAGAQVNSPLQLRGRLGLRSFSSFDEGREKEEVRPQTQEGVLKHQVLKGLSHWENTREGGLKQQPNLGREQRGGVGQEAGGLPGEVFPGKAGTDHGWMLPFFLPRNCPSRISCSVTPRPCTW